jgi:hypothetical protein
MNASIRPAVPEDASECGQICYKAFQAIGDAHSFPNYWPSTEAVAMYERITKHDNW